MSNFIGISGNARVGKNLFCSLVRERINKSSFEYSIAGLLKNELKDFIWKNYQIDVFNCSPEDKELIRPLLVFHGKIRRKQTNGRYWIDNLDSFIHKRECDVKMISDVRFDEYEQDEVYWVKNVLKGVLVHIKAYRKEGNELIFTKPANQEEADNEKKLFLKSDYWLEWEYCNGDYSKLYPAIDKFIIWFNNLKTS